MLSQIELWTERAGMLMDLIFMLRLLKLRLHRTYLFITLFGVLALMYDVVELALGSRSESFDRVILLSRFVYAIVFPLAIWDLFEEAKPQIDKLRRLATSRMVSSLLFISLWGLLIAALTGGDESDRASFYLMRVALILWTGTVAAALAYLWVMKRGIKAGQLTLPWNTMIWVWYFQWLLIVEAILCVLELLIPTLKALGNQWSEAIGEGCEPVLQAGAVLITAWCVYRLRAIPQDDANVPAEMNG